MGGARFGGPGAVATSTRTPSAPMPTVTLPRSGSAAKVVKRFVAVAVVLALLVAGFVLLVQPRLQEKQALDAAARTPAVLPRIAPAALAGQKAMSAPGVNPSTSANAATSAGSSWAWSRS